MLGAAGVLDGYVGAAGLLDGYVGGSWSPRRVQSTFFFVHSDGYVGGGWSPRRVCWGRLES